MTSDDFCAQMLAHQRPTRELIPQPGDPGLLPITKLGGVPWWPQGRPRPRCRDGHAMSFAFQVRLSDVLGLKLCDDTLLSFHYCLECSYLGNMSWGWEEPGPATGYDVALLSLAQDIDADGAGIVAEPIIEPYSVAFRKTLEVPLADELGIYVSELPDDYPQVADDFDENIYPGLVHVARSKIGGWPHWVQNCAWPAADESWRIVFVGQLDWMLFPRSPWCNGGYAYLFALMTNGKPAAGGRRPAAGGWRLARWYCKRCEHTETTGPRACCQGRLSVKNQYPYSFRGAFSPSATHVPLQNAG